MILRRPTEFYPKWTICIVSYDVIDILKMAAVSYVRFALVVDHTQSVIDDCCFILKLWFGRIYSFRDSAIKCENQSKDSISQLVTFSK